MDEIAIEIGGVLSAILGIGHCLFYRGFGWHEDFGKTRLITTKVLYTIHVFLIPMFFFFAYASFFHTKELVGGTPLGIAVTAFYSVFWLFRGLWQMIYFRPSRTKGFEKLRLLHYFMIIYFVFLWAAYTFPLLSRFL
jgi:hypothetical protein